MLVTVLNKTEGLPPTSMLLREGSVLWSLTAHVYSPQLRPPSVDLRCAIPFTTQSSHDGTSKSLPSCVNLPILASVKATRVPSDTQREGGVGIVIIDMQTSAIHASPLDDIAIDIYKRTGTDTRTCTGNLTLLWPWPNIPQISYKYSKCIPSGVCSIEGIR